MTAKVKYMFMLISPLTEISQEDSYHWQVTGSADIGETPQMQEQQLPPHNRVRKHSKTRQPLLLNELQKCKF
jgi:hypothetical protein